jgi:superfamily II RNA helicase
MIFLLIDTSVASSNSNKTNTIPKTFPNQSKSSSTSSIQKPTNQASNNDDIITIEEDELISMGLVDDENKENDENDEDKDLELFFASESYMNNNTTMANSRLSTGAANSLTDDFVDEDKLEKLTVGIDDQTILSSQYYDTTGCDLSAVNEWFYPSNMPTRNYQYSIIEQCLHKNTMVVLPTGLGKTFVAAVVMLNFYRWYPNGKIIFMAPTKPLVNQQSDACYKIVGILKEDMVQMTGQMQPDKRKALWDTKRVFFLTPQVISNDILRGIVDVNLIKLVVIDEAHKALGEYAFCKVIESIVEVNKNFRIVALTATPGSDIKAVQNVIDKLLISNIELRSDESIDIQQYNHGREVNKFVLPLTNEVLKIKNAFANVRFDFYCLFFDCYLARFLL